MFFRHCISKWSPGRRSSRQAEAWRSCAGAVKKGPPAPQVSFLWSVANATATEAARADEVEVEEWHVEAMDRGGGGRAPPLRP